tara:strand:+ start:653 stop:952 length:300 start_codon:yes stop_codon:yes gene_type:complete
VAFLPALRNRIADTAIRKFHIQSVQFALSRSSHWFIQSLLRDAAAGVHWLASDDRIGYWFIQPLLPIDDCPADSSNNERSHWLLVYSAVATWLLSDSTE